jgi:integrase
LLKAEKDTTAAEAVIFSMLTGIRTSTTLSLCWQNNGDNNYVDLDNNRLIIRHHKNKKNKDPYVVPILDVATTHLNSLPRQAKNNYVFSARQGSHISKKRYATIFEAALKKLDINEDLKKLITPYCTRHSFSSYLANKAMSFEDIAQLLTHSTTRMLKERYGHLEEGYKTKLKTRLDSAFSSEP